MSNRIGRRIRQVRYQRAARGLPYSQVWLAEEAGCSRQTLMNIEAGSYWCSKLRYYVEYTPSEGMLTKIAEALGVKLADLIGETDESA